MVCRAPHSQNDAGVLDGAIFIDKQPAGCADVWLLGVVEEVLEPVFREDFGIVVQKHKKVAGGGTGTTADAYKGLGLVYFKEGNKSQAKKAFKSYLAKAPHAPDRSYIEDYLAQCN